MMNNLDKAFLQTSAQAEGRRRRNKRLVTLGLAVGLVLTTGSTFVAGWQMRVANRNNLLTLVQTATALNAAGDSFEAELVALRAAKQFQRSPLLDAEIQNKIHTELLKAQLPRPNEITRLTDYSAEVWAVQFSPDGNTLATASDDGTAQLWTREGTLIATLNGHSGSVWDVQFSPDGTTLATASLDGTAKLWTSKGTLITTLDGHSGSVKAVQFRAPTATPWPPPVTTAPPSSGHLEI